MRKGKFWLRDLQSMIEERSESMDLRLKAVASCPLENGTHLIVAGDSIGQIWVHTFHENDMTFTQRTVNPVHETPVLSLTHVNLPSQSKAFCSGCSNGTITLFTIDNVNFEVSRSHFTD